MRGRYHSDGSVGQSTTEEEFYIPKSEFDVVVSESLLNDKLRLKAKQPGTVVCDVTKALEKYFSSQLHMIGRTEFPVRIYGIKTR